MDVAIIGGGPAGSACALTLRKYAPGLAVTLVEATRYDRPRVGETLPPAATSLLEHLGVLPAFLAQGHRPAFGTAAAWGSERVRDDDFIFSARGAGWQLDRCAFDAMLADAASQGGAALLTGTRCVAESRTAGGWELKLSDGSTLSARFLVDATGARAALARRQGARTERLDRLTGFVRIWRCDSERSGVDGAFDPRPGADSSFLPRSGVLVEACAHGWWYTAPLPDGTRIVAFMTDADIGRGLCAGSAEGWERLLADAPHVSSVCAGGHAVGPMVVRPAASRRLMHAAGDDWIAAGDAASSFDPLSSAGIVKALRSGTLAGYAVIDRLVKGLDNGAHRFDALVAREFDGFAAARMRYYARERRWPGHPFWQRRDVAATARNLAGAT